MKGDVVFQELYDHRIDPGEHNNLARAKSDIVERLSKQLAKDQNDKQSLEQTPNKELGGTKTDVIRTKPEHELSSHDQ